MIRVLLISVWLLTSVAWGAAPTLDYLYPAGGRIGTSFVLTSGGSAEPWPAKAWCDDPAVIIVAQTNKNKFDVTIGTNAAPGLHFIRLWNNDGTSAPRAFSIGLLPEVEEKDPNNNYKQATNVLALPITVNGKFEKNNDNDTFALDLVAWKTFAASFEGYRLGSMMDPVLHLFDASGKRVAFNHDWGTLDPYLSYTPTNSGRFYLQTMAFTHPASVNVAFHGNASAIYRLHLSQDGFAENLWPIAIQQGATNQNKVRGPNLAEFNGTVPVLHQNFGTRLQHHFVAGLSNAVPVLFGEGVPLLDKEPNNNTNEAQKVSIPVSVSGTISPEDRIDRYALPAKKDQHFTFELWSARIGSGLDCVIRIHDENGTEIARSSTLVEERDPGLTWKVPRDGQFSVTISDLRSGKYKPGIYHLFIEEEKPNFKPTVDAHSFQLESGKTNEIALKVARKNYDGKLLCSVFNLPKEFQLVTAELAEKAAGPLKIFVPASVTNWQGAVQITLTSTNNISQKTLFNLQGGDGEQAGIWFLPDTAHLWLQVVPPKK